MSSHRYPCLVPPPEALAPGPDGHTHACIHDTADWLAEAIAEHQCDCGTTWRAHSLAPAPDKGWLVIEEPETWRERFKEAWTAFWGGRSG